MEGPFLLCEAHVLLVLVSGPHAVPVEPHRILLLCEVIGSDWYSFKRATPDSYLHQYLLWVGDSRVGYNHLHRDLEQKSSVRIPCPRPDVRWRLGPRRPRERPATIQDHVAVAAETMHLGRGQETAGGTTSREMSSLTFVSLAL